MIIRTKYDTGDIVYYLWEGRIIEAVITQSHFMGTDAAYSIFYDIEYYSKTNGGKLVIEKIPELCLYESVDALFDHMRKNMHEYLNPNKRRQ